MKENNIMRFMALESYERWYKENVSPYLDDETKLVVAKRISELSLRDPIWLEGFHYPLTMFPEMAPFNHIDHFSGMMLFAVMSMILRELGFSTPTASSIAMQASQQKHGDSRKAGLRHPEKRSANPHNLFLDAIPFK